MNKPQHPTKRVLVFPAGMPKALEYIKLVPEDVEIFGASSVRSEPARANYQVLDYLPYVNDSAFENALIALIQKHGITHIYAPHQVVWHFLRMNLQRMAPQVQLENIAPVRERLVGAFAAMEFARNEFCLPHLQAVGTQRTPLKELERAALFNYFRLTPGESDYQKLVGFYEAMRYCPPGDVVEIGSLWGRTALALTWLAKRFEIGKVLCIDPWVTDEAAEVEASSLVLESYVDYHDIRDAYSVFRMNLAVFQGSVNCIRDFSYNAVNRYGPDLTVEDDVLGEIAYQGRIAFLHVDGNHSYEYTLQDIQQWFDKVAPGGWIVVDDYVWAFNDGPRRAADEVLMAEARRIESAFVTGGALFMQVR